ncbi:ribonuclease E/G, partial [Micromonospora chersina]
MLENEPEGGERTGAEPAEATASSSTEGTAEVKPPARKRASRRKAAPLNQPEQTDAPVEASTAATGSGESPQAEVFAPVAGDLEAAPKTRRRRKATPAKAVEEPVAAAGVEPASDEVVPPVKVTRTRRRKTTPPPVEAPADESPTEAPAEAAGPAVEPHAVAEPQADAEPPAAPAEGEPEDEDAVGEDAEDEPSPEDQARLARAGGPEDRTGEVSPGAAVPGPAEEPAPTTRRRRAALSAPTVLFMPPQPEEAPVVRVTYPVAEEPV